MTDGRASAIIDMVIDNYELALMKMNRSNWRHAMVAAAVLTIDDIVHIDPEDPGYSLLRKMQKLNNMLEDEKDKEGK